MVISLSSPLHTLALVLIYLSPILPAFIGHSLIFVSTPSKVDAVKQLQTATLPTSESRVLSPYISNDDSLFHSLSTSLITTLDRLDGRIFIIALSVSGTGAPHVSSDFLTISDYLLVPLVRDVATLSVVSRSLHPDPRILHCSLRLVFRASSVPRSLICQTTLHLNLLAYSFPLEQLFLTLFDLVAFSNRLP